MLAQQPSHEAFHAGASPWAIQKHYDVGTDFYRLWLDESLTYSAGRWSPAGAADGNASLERAQTEKIDFHLNAVGARPGASILDVGCGWGSTLLRAVRHHGAGLCVGLTLSKAQYEHVRCLECADIEVSLESYEVHEPSRVYDGIVSIGAFEHFARPCMSAEAKTGTYRRFFAKCRDWLKPDGRLSLQTICWGDASPELRARILPEHVFPESDLPTVAEIFAASAGVLQVVTLENRRADYIATLEEWLRRLRNRRSDVLDLRNGAELFCAYEDYLRQSIVGFKKNRISLLRIAFERPRN